MREIVFDTETTGLDPYSGHRVVEIGCVELMNHLPTGRHFHCYLNPERMMPKEAEQIHGLSDDFLKDKPLFKALAADFLRFIADDPLIIHNAAFDMKFINAELELAGFPRLDDGRARDTVFMARQKFPGQSASLDALCKRFAIDLSARTKHGALMDAQLLAEVYLELLGGRQAALTLERQTSGDYAMTGDMPPAALPIRHFPPTADEIAAHKVMLEKIKNPIWSA
ncbi:MAG: DNA polymerase III subunit epsilon [Rickettsiales bacterium]|jgi:DNA polymerase-3 subunit epsilon|nr:DNA polymerase III subunit epsilon [Rickettsiales bacterium]